MPHALTQPRTLHHRDASVQAQTWDATARTVEVIWTTGAMRRARDPWTGVQFDEQLVVDEAAVDMSRFDAGAVPVLDGHDRFSGVSAILGVAQRGWLVNGEGRALLRLSERPELAGVVADIAGGVVRNVSVGYSADEVQVIRAQDRTDGGTVDLWLVTRWTPHEISFVAVPADPDAGTRSADHPPFQPTFSNSSRTTMPQPNNGNSAAASTRHAQHRLDADVRELVTRHAAGLPSDFADQLLARGLTTMDQAARAVLDELARHDRAAGGHLNVRGSTGQPAANPVEQMADALAVRMGVAEQDRANPYRHARVADMARDLLELRGVRTTDMSPTAMIERALHSTSDFPELLQGAGQRVLRQAYAAYTGGLRQICRASTARDFRAKQSLMLGEWPELLQVNEHGEFKSGSMAEAKTAYSLVTYGRIFGVTRQALVNDDLDAFGDMAARIGRAASELEAKVLVNLLTSNPTMSDSVALFHADHGNLGTGAGSALQLSSLTAARKAMRLQKGADGRTPIDVTPTFLVVPAALETTGEQLIAQLQPTQIGDVNPFGGKLQLVVDPRLDAASATAWYLAASPGTVDTIEYSYLESAGGPEVIVKDGFEVDGLQMKGRLDFGAGVLDWRGLYKANGA